MDLPIAGNLGGGTSLSPVTPLAERERKSWKPRPKKAQKPIEPALVYEPFVHDVHSEVFVLDRHQQLQLKRRWKSVSKKQSSRNN